MLVAIAKPAASSFALLILLPVERRSIACPSILLAAIEAFDARNALIFVLITAIVCSRCLIGTEIRPAISLQERQQPEEFKARGYRRLNFF
ncbi:MAG TPA: hypothetical protein VI199_03475 [Novosphingobium sp.]